MNFWYGASSGAEVAAERHAVLLRDGDTWVWKHDDDLRHKQGGVVKKRPGPRPRQTTPQPPRPTAPLFTTPGTASGFRAASPASRATVTALGVYVPLEHWQATRLRPRLPTYPHRLQMSEAEKAGVAARVAKAAARTKRRENPPASAHAMSKRARARSVPSRRVCTGAGVCTEPACVYGSRRVCTGAGVCTEPACGPGYPPDSG